VEGVAGVWLCLGNSLYAFPTPRQKWGGESCGGGIGVGLSRSRHSVSPGTDGKVAKDDFLLVWSRVTEKKIGRIWHHDRSKTNEPSAPPASSPTGKGTNTIKENNDPKTPFPLALPLQLPLTKYVVCWFTSLSCLLYSSSSITHICSPLYFLSTIGRGGSAGATQAHTHTFHVRPCASSSSFHSNLPVFSFFPLQEAEDRLSELVRVGAHQAALHLPVLHEHKRLWRWDREGGREGGRKGRGEGEG